MNPVVELHLRFESFESMVAASSGAAPAEGIDPVVLRAGPVALARKNGLPVRGTRPLPQNAAAVVQPIVDAEHRLRALMRMCNGTEAWVNGDFKLKFFTVRPGDVVQWAPDWGLRVALYHRPGVGAPGPERLGLACPVCRVAFTTDTRVVVCACGMALHCEADPQNGLQCAQLRGECPGCGRRLRLTPGYVDEEVQAP